MIWNSLRETRLHARRLVQIHEILSRLQPISIYEKSNQLNFASCMTMHNYTLLVTILKKSLDQDIIASVNESQFESEHVSIDMLKQSIQKLPQHC